MHTITKALLPALTLLSSVPLVHAQVNYGTAFNPFTFEGTHIDGHYGPGTSYTFNVGHLNGTNFITGNNLQDGVSAPSYHWAPSFGWQIDGYVAKSNSQANFIDPGTGVLNNAYVGAGNVSYPGNAIDAAYGNDRLADAFNLNAGHSPTGLQAAPGLGENFMDTYTEQTATQPYTAQLSLTFLATLDRSLKLTIAFGGRDNYASPTNSADSTAWYRIVDRSANNAVVAFGNTGATGTMYEYYKDLEKVTNTVATAPADAGVDFQSWEYYQSTWNAKANHLYDLQILLPEELNYDLAFGSQYQDITGVILPPIPEPSTYGLLGAGALAGLAAFRRRRLSRKAA